MCQNVRPLAKGDALHFVSRCEHGTVFLTWQRCTLSFDPADFVRLSTFVSCAAKGDCTLCSGDFSLYPTPTGLRLWVAGSGLALSKPEFERLRDLLENALWTLQKTSAEAPTRHPTAPPAQKVDN